MLPKYEQVSYELMRPLQIKARREERPIVYIPTGSLEWHSWHNPLGTDALKAHAICCEAALKYGGVVLPPFYQGLLGEGWGPQGWEGYTQGWNEEAMFEAAMRGIAKAMIKGQWKVIVGVTGHDVPTQRDAMQRAIEAETNGTDAAGFAVMEGELHQPTKEIPYICDHAAAWETSCMMYAYPEKVDLDELKQRIVYTDDCQEMVMPGDGVDRLHLNLFKPDGSGIGNEGIGGPDPLKYASPELGRLIVETMAELIGAKARALLAL